MDEQSKIIPRKRCPKCSAVFEGDGVADLYSCDQCGNGYLSPMPSKDLDEGQDHPLPRSGGSGNVFHTRDNF